MMYENIDEDALLPVNALDDEKEIIGVFTLTCFRWKNLEQIFSKWQILENSH